MTGPPPDAGGPLPRLEEVAPLVPALLDLLLPAPAGERESGDAALAALGELVERCAPGEAESCITDVRTILPRLREEVLLDIRAAVEGDPACTGPDEAALCYPGVHAVAVHRLAHVLHKRGLPLVPRLLAECVHQRTGIDIHPGARIGHSFFIDHGTGVVVGATARIGEHCTLYQGVTLGTLRVQRGMDREAQRHPTLEDHVVVYAGATILGGDTVIGAGSVVGGGVFLTESVPPMHVATNPRPVIKMRPNPDRPAPSFQI